jgi:putative acetyltransferase
MKIREFLFSDAASLAEIFHEAVHTIGSKDYSPSQTHAWSPAPVSAETFLARISDTRFVFVAVDDKDTPLGFIELEADGHIDCFYCHPDFAGTGVGNALYARLEEAALQAGLARLYTEASEAARRFFLKAGFKVIERRDFEYNGAEIHNYLMENRLH